MPASKEPTRGTNEHDLTGTGYAAPGQTEQRGNRRSSGNIERKYGDERDRPGSHIGASVPWSDDGSGRNRRSVWTIATQAYPGAHFATFPSKLVEPCIKAGTSERGACADCGASWERTIERTRVDDRDGTRERNVGGRTDGFTRLIAPGGVRPDVVTTTGWRPTCRHDAAPVPATVLDPFAGTGTVGLVAQRLSRRAVLIDLNPDYIAQCLERNQDQPLGLVEAAS